MAIPLRTMRDLRTRSGRVDGPREPYRAFMEISALEMEKARRGKERDSAMRRVEMIDARFREIEALKAKLLLEAAADRGVSDSDIEIRGRTEKARRAAVLSRTPASQGFKIRY